MRDLYVRFMAPTVANTTSRLLEVMDGAMRDEIKRIHLLISTLGGSVFHGLSIYNFLRGLPIDVHTYNFGSVDSMGVIVFCAGKKRFSVPHARFLIHGVRFNIHGGASFDELQLEENLKSLKIDQENIARVIADTTGKPLEQVEADMNSRITLNPTQAKEYGLVHEIQSALCPAQTRMVVVDEVTVGQPIQVTGMSGPLHEAYTRSFDADVGA